MFVSYNMIRLGINNKGRVKNVIVWILNNIIKIS